MVRKHGYGVLYPQIEALLYDLDGTLADTEEELFATYAELLTERGRDFSTFDYRTIVGVTALEAARVVALAFSLDETPEDFLLQWRARLAERLRTHLRPRPGAREALEKAKVSGATVALVTSAREDHANDVLDRLGFRSFFRVMITWESPGLTRHKPHPDPYQLAVKTLKVAKNRCVAFEDSVNGVTSARDAGILVVGIPHRFSPREELEKIANHVVPDGKTIGDFDLRDIQHFLPQ